MPGSETPSYRREIAPFTLLDGATVEGDESSNRRVIRGGSLRLNEGYEIESDPESEFITFRLSDSGGGTGGRFRCACTGGGACHVSISHKNGETVIKCLSSGCSGSCNIDVVLDPQVILTIA